MPAPAHLVKKGLPPLPIKKKKRNCRFGYGPKGGCKKNPETRSFHAWGPSRKGYVDPASRNWVEGSRGGMYYINKNGKKTYKK